MRFVYVFLLSISIVSCATTNVKTYVDPEHAGKKYSKIVVDIPNAEFQFREMLAGKVCGGLRGRGVECIGKDDFLPPTREYSDKLLFELVSKNNIDGWLIVNIGSGGTSSQYIGSQTFGSATAYGNTVYGNANSMPMYAFNRQQGYSIVMYDMTTKHKAFVMDASTYAQGLANITDSVFASSLAEKIVKEMVASGAVK